MLFDYENLFFDCLIVHFQVAALACGMPEEKRRWRAVAREISGQKYVGLLHPADSHFPTLETKT